MEKVLVLGSINIDFVSFVSRYPKPGETLISSDFGIFQGGKGANQAIALAKLGVPTLMLGKVGKDVFSNFAISSLKESGVDISGITQSQKVSTGVASIWVNTQGQNSIVIYPGANKEVDEDFIIHNEMFFADSSWLLTQFEIPSRSILTALKLAKKYGLKIVIDPAPVKEKVNNDIWEWVDYLLPNEIELKELTKTRNILEAIHILKSWGVKEVIVKLGKRGAGYEDKGILNIFPAVPVEKVVDTTGAGDCFIAGFLSGMIQSGDINRAIKIGNLISSYSIQKKGAAKSFPKKSEVDWNRVD